jgi:activator of HSP90 ATPase
MAWRTSQFPASAPAARIVVDLSPTPAGTTLRLRQWDTPPNQIAGYRDGWEEHYFAPMRAHFGA